MKGDNKIAVFKGKKVRRTIHNNEWWFSVIDVIEVLSGTHRPRKYWSDLKQKLIKEGYTEVSEKIGQVKRLYHHSNLCLKGVYNLYHPYYWKT